MEQIPQIQNNNKQIDAKEFLPKSDKIRHRKEAFLKAYKATFGNIALSCQMTGIKSRQTVYLWREKDLKFKTSMQEQLETNKDFAEYGMMQNIAAGDQRAIEYYLNNKAKDRGYRKNPDDDDYDPEDPMGTETGITIHETRIYEDGRKVIDIIGEDVTDQETDG